MTSTGISKLEIIVLYVGLVVIGFAADTCNRSALEWAAPEDSVSLNFLTKCAEGYV